jgi:hypothetical protein
MQLNRSGWSLLFLAVLFVGLAAWGAEPDPLVEELKNAGVEVTREGVEKFLEPMRLTPARLERVRTLLAALGSDDFETRDKATTALIAMPHLPESVLKEGITKDPEIKRRVEEVLDDPGRGEAEHNLFLTLRVIEAKQIKGLSPLLLELLPQWLQEHLIQAAKEAVVASAERADGKLLREMLAGRQPRQVRVAATSALAAVFAKEVSKELEELLQDTDPYVSLAAVSALLNQDSRKPLAVLVRLLEAEQIEVRQAAANTLSEVSGQQIEYASYEEPKKRASGVAAWRDWVNGEGQTATLNLPVGMKKAFRGRILVNVYGEGKIREIDATTGKTLFEAGGWSYAWGAHATPEGRRLAVDYSRSVVVEYDAQGRECWRRDLPGGAPTCVQRLPNGRTLVALSSLSKVVEIDRDGKVVWEFAIPGLTSAAQRLPDGTTLIALQDANKIIIVNSQGKILRQLEGLTRPHTAQQLSNGNILVCEFDKGIFEYDRNGKVVWSKVGLNNPAQAQRLPSGNTLIAETDGLIEVDPKGKEVRHFHMGRARFFAY